MRLNPGLPDEAYHEAVRQITEATLSSNAARDQPREATS